MLDPLNFDLSIYLHNSLCVQVVKVVEMLRTCADASVHGLVKYSLHIKTKELIHFFKKRPLSYENVWLFSYFSLKQWLMDDDDELEFNDASTLLGH